MPGMNPGTLFTDRQLRVPRVSAELAPLEVSAFAAEHDGIGVFAWWPEDSVDWLHPYDRPVAEDVIPCDRVWRRYRGGGDFDLYRQGPWRFRARPRLWLNIRDEAVWVGDSVEVLSQQGRRRPFVAKIAEVFWNRRYGRCEYVLDRSGWRQPQRYSREAFRVIQPLVEGEPFGHVVRPSLVADEALPTLAPEGQV